MYNKMPFFTIEITPNLQQMNQDIRSKLRMSKMFPVMHFLMWTGIQYLAVYKMSAIQNYIFLRHKISF
jgi:hypothetical protein